MSKKFDDLDFKILERLLDDSSSTLISLANSLNADKRSISRRINRLKEEGVIRKFTIDIDWTKLGMAMDAYVGTRTSVGEEYVKPPDYKPLLRLIAESRVT